MYRPPFEITARIVELISRISERIGEIHAFRNTPANVRLRKENRIKTIHSSLAIENNSLGIEQITAILGGKKVLGSPREITEVKNAIAAYELLLELDPLSEADLLKAHKLMMMIWFPKAESIGPARLGYSTEIAWCMSLRLPIAFLFSWRICSNGSNQATCIR